MCYHPRIECSKVATFQTTKSLRSELWFVNSSPLEQAILGYAAKYTARYKMELYALAIEGNHVQFPARFPKANRAHFMRDFNSSIARAVPRYQPSHGGGRFWKRRYSAEYLPGNEDIEEQFFYTVLQPVQDGLIDQISDYPGYNCFEDAISGRARVFKSVRWKEYNDARRWKKKVSIEKFTDEHELSFTRLPGYEELTPEAYARTMREKLKERTKRIIEGRGSKKALGREALKRVKPGSLPQHTKTSSINDHRPRILSKDPERRKKGKAWYFSIYFKYREVSEKYRNGDPLVKFPDGTYKPPLFTVGYKKSIL